MLLWSADVFFALAFRLKKQLFFEVLDGHSVDNRVIVANHRQRTGQRTLVTGG